MLQGCHETASDLSRMAESLESGEVENASWCAWGVTYELHRAIARGLAAAAHCSARMFDDPRAGRTTKACGSFAAWEKMEEMNLAEVWRKEIVT